MPITERDALITFEDESSNDFVDALVRDCSRILATRYFDANVGAGRRGPREAEESGKTSSPKSERGEENPIKLESAKKLTSYARFGSCVFATAFSSAPPRSFLPGSLARALAEKRARKLRPLKLYPAVRSLVYSFAPLSLSLSASFCFTLPLTPSARERNDGTCRRGNNTVENSTP